MTLYITISRTSGSSMANHVLGYDSGVCLSPACVCVILVNKISPKSYKKNLIKFCGYGPKRNRLDIGGNSDSLLNPGSFSWILCYLQIRRKLTFCSYLCKL